MSNLTARHFDEARKSVLEVLHEWVDSKKVSRALLSPDIFARIRVLLWHSENINNNKQEFEERLLRAAGAFWGGLWNVLPDTPQADREFMDALWDEGVSNNRADTVRINERHRSLGVWLHSPLSSPWEVESLEFPPIVSFFAFKGGAGRSTALAIFAAQRAHHGERVVVIDLDLAAPGLGPLLTEPESVQYGVVDYCLEQPLLKQKLDLREYYIRVNKPDVVGMGEIFVFPAGRLDENYPLKLARLDFTPSDEAQHPWQRLLLQIRETLQPNWILLDSRAGLSESAGFALGGLAHLNVLFGNTSVASGAV